MGRGFVVKFFKKVASAVTFFIYSKLLCAPHFSFTRLTTKTQSQRDFHNEKVALAVSVLSLTGRFYIQTPHRHKQRSQQGHSCFHPYRTRYQSLTIMITLGFLKNCLKIPHNRSHPYHNPKRHDNLEFGVFGLVSEGFDSEPRPNTATQPGHP